MTEEPDPLSPTGSAGSRLGALHEIVASLSVPEQPVEQAVGRVLENVRAILGFTEAWAGRLDPDTDNFVVCGAAGLAGRVPAALSAADSATWLELRRAVADGSVWAVGQRVVHARLPRLAQHAPEYSTVVLVPLTIDRGGALLGVAGFHHLLTRPATDGEAEFLGLVADLLGQALHRARLDQAGQQARARAAAAAGRAEDLAALAAALAATVTVDDVIAALSAYVQRAAACRTFSLRRVDRAGRSASAMHVAGVPTGYRDKFDGIPLDTPGALAEVVATGAAVFLPSASANRRRHGATAAAPHIALGIEAQARLPLYVEAELIAVLSLGFREPRRFTTAEKQFLTTMADLAAQALGRALSTRRLRVEARRHRLTSRAQSAINRRLDTVEELHALARVVVPELADHASVHVLHHPVLPGIDPALPLLTDRVAACSADGHREAPLRTDIAWYAGDPLIEAIRSGASLTDVLPMPGVPEWARRAGSAEVLEGGIDRTVLAPVLVDGHVAAVAAFGIGEHRSDWDSDELTVIEEIAGYASVALGHGLTYERARNTALVLQRSLLSPPPEVLGLELCARYLPAGRDEVGGDWYDAFEVRPGELALAVGDVVGHDITAAAAMGQLRAVLRALAMDPLLDPAGVLDRLAEANRCLHITPMATVLFARLRRDVERWEFSWSSAGHLPPVLVAPDGTAAPVEQPGGVALVAALQTDGHRTATLHLTPGSRLLVYTDGLVERPGEDLLDSIAAMCALAQESVDAPLAKLCDELLAAGPGRDDAALLAVAVDAPVAQI